MSRKYRAKMPSAVSVVARSYPDRIIGIDNTLPWHLGTDLKNFKSLTQGHAIIMGRKTFESLGRPLPNRLNIVLSREKISDYDNVKWAQDPRTALLLADFYSICNANKQFFVIGGERIYAIFDEYINKIFLTDVFSGPLNGDAKFDFDFPVDEWYFRFEKEFPKTLIDDFPFRISYMVRRRQKHRERMISEFKHRNVLFDANWSTYASSQFSDSEREIEAAQLSFIERLGN